MAILFLVAACAPGIPRCSMLTLCLTCLSPLPLLPPLLVVSSVPTPSLWQALPSSQLFGLYQTLTCQHLALYPPAEQALPNTLTLLHLCSPHPILIKKECCVVVDNDLEERLMSGDLPLVPPYAPQPLHNTTPPDNLIHWTATLCCCIGTQHSPDTLCLIASHLLAY